MAHILTGNRGTRREWLAQTVPPAVALASGTWMSRLAAAAQSDGAQPRKSCILLWMNGGPSQTDTFDMKPGHANNGPFQPIATRTPGLSICEHLPKLAQWSDRLAVIRSMTTREGDHGRARQNLRTGYAPQGPIQFPVLGSLVSNEHREREVELPNYVSILSRGLFQPGIPAAGFLGPNHAPLLVEADGGELSVQNLRRPEGVTADQATERVALLDRLQRPFLSGHPGISADSFQSASTRATCLMSPAAAEAFDLSQEEAALRERYGPTPFGRGCLLARRLVERGVPFVEVTLGGWDTHDNNFEEVQGLCGPLDLAWSGLLEDLRNRGLLDSTLVVWMGEFGRTPAINPRNGRDHYPRAWSVVLGGAIRGRSVIGKTGADGMLVEDRPVSTSDLMGTICLALGLDPRRQNPSNVARPIRLVDPESKPIHEIVV